MNCIESSNKELLNGFQISNSGTSGKKPAPLKEKNLSINFLKFYFRIKYFSTIFTYLFY